MARRTRFSNTLQRSISLLTGEERDKPINPIRRQHGVVSIGNRMLRVVTEGPTPISDWNARKQAERPHECAAALLGMQCGHATN